MTRSQFVIVIGAIFTLASVVAGRFAQAQTRPPAPPDRSHGITPVQARAQAEEIARDLREARAAVGRINDRAARERIEALLSRAELRARDLAEDLARARPTQPPSPLPAAEFAKLLRGLTAEAFDDGKLTFVENFASRAPLNCQQAVALLSSFAFDEKRIEALKAIYPNLVDPFNLNDVLAVFRFPSSRAAARKAVGLK